MKTKTLYSMLFASACLFVSAPVFAESPIEIDGECTMDEHCPMDYTCQEIGGYACAEPARCPDGDPDCQQTEPDCESGVIMGCVPPPPEVCDPSQGSMACDGGLTCVSYTFESCSRGGAVGGGSTDGEPDDPDGEDSRCVDGPEGTRCGEDSDGDSGGDSSEEVSCTTETESYCVPQYFAPCEVDVDCGPGFACVEDVVCEPCAGSRIVTCTIDEDGNEVCDGSETPDECDPSCEPTGRKTCELEEVSCEMDADCPTGLVCETFETSSPPSVCTVDENGNETCEDAPAPDPYSVCLPADWERWVGGYGYDAEAADGGGAEEGVPTGNYDDAIGRASGKDGDDWEIVDAEVGGSHGADADADGSEDGEAGGSGGCQAAGGQAPGAGFGLLAALGMMLGIRRRRR